MRFSQSHAGKWVATKGSKVVGSDTVFARLWKKVQAREDRRQITVDLVPPGYITGRA